LDLRLAPSADQFLSSIAEASNSGWMRTISRPGPEVMHIFPFTMKTTRPNIRFTFTFRVRESARTDRDGIAIVPLAIAKGQTALSSRRMA
jgi:hypothetical protein